MWYVRSFKFVRLLKKTNINMWQQKEVSGYIRSPMSIWRRSPTRYIRVLPGQNQRRSKQKRILRTRQWGGFFLWYQGCYPLVLEEMQSLCRSVLVHLSCITFGVPVFNQSFLLHMVIIICNIYNKHNEPLCNFSQLLTHTPSKV